MTSDPKDAGLTYNVRRQVDVAKFFGVSPGTVKEWNARGMPCARGNYDLSEIAKWLHAGWLQRSGPWQARGKSSDDPDMEGEANDEGLERYRLAKAEIAELDLAERRHTLLSRDSVRGTLLRFAAILRRAGERFSKQFGNDAVQILNDSLDECQSVIDHAFTDDSPTDLDAAD